MGDSKRWIRSRQAAPDFPIVAVTGMEQLNLRSELKLAGANEVLIKPYTTQLLLEALAAVIPRT